MFSAICLSCSVFCNRHQLLDKCLSNYTPLGLSLDFSHPVLTGHLTEKITPKVFYCFQYTYIYKHNYKNYTTKPSQGLSE